MDVSDPKWIRGLRAMMPDLHIPAPPRVPAEAREVADTVPPPSRLLTHEELRERGLLCFVCHEAPATRDRPELPAQRANRAWLRCEPCSRAFHALGGLPFVEPEVDSYDDEELFVDLWDVVPR